MFHRAFLDSLSLSLSLALQLSFAFSIFVFHFFFFHFLFFRLFLSGSFRKFDVLLKMGWDVENDLVIYTTLLLIYVCNFRFRKPLEM